MIEALPIERSVKADLLKRYTQGVPSPLSSNMKLDVERVAWGAFYKAGDEAVARGVSDEQLYTEAIREMRSMRWAAREICEVLGVNYQPQEAKEVQRLQGEKAVKRP